MADPVFEATLRKLHALGISATGARELVHAKAFTHRRDRKRLALVLAGLLAHEEVHLTRQGRHNVATTNSGIRVEFEDAGDAPASSGSATQSHIRTRSGILISFDDTSA